MDKKAKSPVEDQKADEIAKTKKTKDESPTWMKGTIEPTTKK